jgi:SNF2 family DNA or RNA helicase
VNLFCRLLVSSLSAIQNNLGELFTLLSLVDPDKFDDRDEFVGKYSHMQVSGGVDDVTSLQKAIAPYFFRRMKFDVEKSSVSPQSSDMSNLRNKHSS